jgi:hypothetical protein
MLYCVNIESRQHNAGLRCGSGEPTAGVVNTTSPTPLGIFTGRDATLINPAAPLNTLRHRREGALAIA